MLTALALAAELVAAQFPQHRFRMQPDLAHGAAAFYEFAPASGQGLPYVQPVCAAAAPYMSGSLAWCKDATGADVSGSVHIPTTAGVSSSTIPVCPNGPDCAAVTMSHVVNGGWGESSGRTYTAPAGFTVCALMRVANLNQNQVLVGLSGGITASTYVFQMYVNTGSQSVFAVNNAAGNAGSLSFSAGIVVGAWHFVCGTVDGATVTEYQDGVAASGQAITGILSASTQRFAVDQFWNGAAFQNIVPEGYFGGAFYTEKVLTAPQIAALAHAVLADNPTGVKGEALTFTRASARMCMNSSGVAGNPIPSGRACVTSGGLSVESGRTNFALQAQAFDNAAWTKSNSGTCAAPTVTADQAIGPDGMTTADRIQFPACSGASNWSIILQGSGNSHAMAGSLFVKGTSGSGTIDLNCYNSTTNQCFNCSYNPSTWTSCTCTNAVAGLTFLEFGNYAATAGCGSSRPANDVLVWQGQDESGAYSTSAIVTTTATVARSAETASVILPVAMNPSIGSHAASFMPEWGLAAEPVDAFILAYDASAEVLFTESPGPNRLCTYDGTNQICVNSTPWSTSSFVRTWSSYAASTQTVNNGSTITGAFDGTMGLAALSTLYLGNRGGGFQIDGVMKQICADPSPARCR